MPVPVAPVAPDAQCHVPVTLEREDFVGKMGGGGGVRPSFSCSALLKSLGRVSRIPPRSPRQGELQVGEKEYRTAS